MLRLDLTLGFKTTGKYRASGSAGNQVPWNYPIDLNITLPADNETIAFLPVLSLAGLIKTRQISCVTLTELYLDRLKRCATACQLRHDVSMSLLPCLPMPCAVVNPAQYASWLTRV